VALVSGWLAATPNVQTTPEHANRAVIPAHAGIQGGVDLGWLAATPNVQTTPEQANRAVIPAHAGIQGGVDLGWLVYIQTHRQHRGTLISKDNS